MIPNFVEVNQSTVMCDYSKILQNGFLIKMWLWVSSKKKTARRQAELENLKAHNKNAPK